MSKRKLLLADDSITIQKVVNLTFADEGIDVVTAGDGDAAMQRIMEDLPDIVMADVNMPGLTGYQICEILRENDATKHIPVILLVGSFEPFDQAAAERVGATSYLTKPFQSIRQLVTQVRELIGTEPEETAAAAEAETPAEHAAVSEPEPVETVMPAPVEQPEPAEEPVPSFVAETTRLEPFAPEPAVESTVVTTEPETDDIESLYRQSVPAAGQEAEAEMAFIDTGIDDEMIETSYATQDLDPGDIGFDDQVARSYESAAFDEPVESQISRFATIPDEAADEAASTETFYDRGENISEAREEIVQPAQTERLDPTVAAAMAHEAMPGIEQPPPPVDEGLADTLPDIEMPAARDTQSFGAETVQMSTRFDSAGSASYEFDEIDLLDLPSPDSGRSVEVTTPAAAAEKGSSLQVVSLAPELIEMIAQRVVEKLSEKY